MSSRESKVEEIFLSCFPDVQLIKQYRHYNKKYFGNKLPNDLQIGWSTVLDAVCTGPTLGGMFAWNNHPMAIWLNYRRCHEKEVVLVATTKFTLLHEMAHVATRTAKRAHGPEFQAEMLRLAQAGAFKDCW